jgi:Fur family ferric uptake transcriptional regulator
MQAKTSAKPKSASLPCGRPIPQLRVKSTDKSDVLRTMMLRLSNYVEEKNLNRSEARTKILETIVSEASHFRAQDFLELLRKRHPEVGKATLYRNLPILVECGVLQEGPQDSEGNKFYELADEDHHDHIVCLDCSKIFEFHDAVIERRQEAVTDHLRFKPQNHRHVIYASCEFLQKNR